MKLNQTYEVKVVLLITISFDQRVALSRALALAVARARLVKQARPQWRESTWLGEIKERCRLLDVSSTLHVL